MYDNETGTFLYSEEVFNSPWFVDVDGNLYIVTEDEIIGQDNHYADAMLRWDGEDAIGFAWSLGLEWVHPNTRGFDERDGYYYK